MKQDSPDALQSVLRPIETATGLPNAHYTDAETFREETSALLHGQWAGIGFGAEIPEPGDAMPIDLLGVPLLALRDQDGTIRVHQNICRHRGMVLVSEKKNIRGTIRCPYHSWCYGLDGSLRATPHVGGPGQNLSDGIRREQLSLITVATHVWRDVIFVNLSGTAPPFETYAADLIARWSEHEQPIEAGTEASRFTLNAACNWKLAVENYCESYHLPWIHPGLNSYSRLEDHYHIEEPGRFSGQGTTVYRQLEGDGGQRFSDFAGLSEFWEAGAEYVALYPNVLFGVQRDHAFAMVLLPDAIDRTAEKTALYYSAPPDPAMEQKNAELWRGVFEEDLFVVEGMQRGRSAPGFDGGKFSPAMDGPTHLFHRWAAEQILAARR